MWSESDFRTAAHVCTLLACVGAIMRWVAYCNRENERSEQFVARMELLGEVRTMLQQNPELGARMGPLIRNPEYRANLEAVKEARTRLRSAVEAAKQANARVKGAKARLQAAREASAAASDAAASKAPSNTTDDAVMANGRKEAVAEATSSLRAAARDASAVGARGAAAAARLRAATAAARQTRLRIAQRARPVGEAAAAATTVEPVEMEEGRGLL